MLNSQAVTPIAEGDPLPPEDHFTPMSEDRLDTIYRAEQLRLLDFLRRRVPVDRAADLVQQTFVRMATLSTAKLTAIASPAAFLRQTAVNLSIDEARIAERRSAKLHVPEDAIELHAPDQLAALEARDMLRRLELALQDLKPRTREIFFAHRIDGYSYVEIAGRTGISVKGVEKQMSRAIAHIDRALGDR